jgi:N-carbamoylputrescine amidase
MQARPAPAFRIGMVQMRCSEAPDENLARALKGIREAALQGANVVCLQELFRSQYFCREEDAALFDLAEAIPGESTEAIAKVASGMRGRCGCVAV